MQLLTHASNTHLHAIIAFRDNEVYQSFLVKSCSNLVKFSSMLIKLVLSQTAENQFLRNLNKNALLRKLKEKKTAGFEPTCSWLRGMCSTHRNAARWYFYFSSFFNFSLSNSQASYELFLTWCAVWLKNVPDPIKWDNLWGVGVGF